MNMIRKKKKKTAAKGGNFTLSIDPKGLAFVGLLVFCTWAAVFYIGFSLGQAKRMPENHPQVVKQIEPEVRAETPEESFAVFKLKDNPSEKPPAKPAPKAEKKPEAESKPKPKPKPEAEAKPKPAPKQPAEKSGGASQSPATEKLYTIQITAISDYNRANNYVKLLREREFDAYLQTITNENGTIIYRVRVGQTNLARAEATLLNLGTVLEGIEPTLLEIK